MPPYEWRGASPFTDNRNDRVVEPGDVVDLDAHVAEPQPGFVPVEPDEGEDDSEDDVEVAEPPLDPAEHTVDELEAALDEQEFTDAELDAIADAEEAGDDRDTALNAIGETRN